MLILIDQHLDYYELETLLAVSNHYSFHLLFNPEVDTRWTQIYTRTKCGNRAFSNVFIEQSSHLETMKVDTNISATLWIHVNDLNVINPKIYKKELDKYFLSPEYRKLF